MGNPYAYPGVVDIYDISKDCRSPELQSSSPLGYLGHESGFAPDGNTFYATSIGTGDVTALDVSDPKLPRIVWRGRYESHGLTVSDDGNRAYLADSSGLIILDVSEVQARRPDPQVREVSRLSWPNITIPQVAHPVTIKGRPYIVEIDEFAENSDGDLAGDGVEVGAGRIIDIADETKPRVVSTCAWRSTSPSTGRPSATTRARRARRRATPGHYCNIPSRVDPGIVACSFIAVGPTGLRHPRSAQAQGARLLRRAAGAGSSPTEPSNYAMSSPEFVPERGEIWYTDGGSGFYNVRVASGVWPFARGRRAPRRGDLGLPSTRTCVSRRSFRLTVRGVRRNDVRSLTVYVDGKRKAVRRGRRLTAPGRPARAPRGTVRVRVVAPHEVRAGASSTSAATGPACRGAAASPSTTEGPGEPGPSMCSGGALEVVGDVQLDAVARRAEAVEADADDALAARRAADDADRDDLATGRDDTAEVGDGGQAAVLARRADRLAVGEDGDAGEAAALLDADREGPAGDARALRPEVQRRGRDGHRTGGARGPVSAGLAGGARGARGACGAGLARGAGLAGRAGGTVAPVSPVSPLAPSPPVAPVSAGSAGSAVADHEALRADGDDAATGGALRGRRLRDGDLRTQRRVVAALLLAGILRRVACDVVGRGGRGRGAQQGCGERDAAKKGRSHGVTFAQGAASHHRPEGCFGVQDMNVRGEDGRSFDPERPRAPAKPGPSGTTALRKERCGWLHHPRHVGHAAAATAAVILVRHLGDDGLRREDVLGDRRRVLQRRARDHRRVDDALGDEVDHLAGRRVEARRPGRPCGRR
jgi:hypothetical protein